MTGASGLRTAVAWVVVAPWVAWAVARLLGLERGWPLSPLMAFAPYASAAGLLAAVVAVVLRRRAAAALALVAALVLAGVLVGRVRADPAPDRGAVPGPRLRVLTFNARLGQAPARDIVALVRATRPDALAVQELTPELADALVRAGLPRELPHVLAAPRSGGDGIGLFSRLRLSPLPGPPLTNVTPRAVVHVPGAPPAELYSVHTIAPHDEVHTAAWRHDLRALPPADTPGALRILAGDFNATLDHAELRRVLDTGYDDAAAEAGEGLRPTWPFGRRRWLPPVTIDHVLADARCGVGEVRTFRVPGSDHKAVLAELILPRG